MSYKEKSNWLRLFFITGMQREFCWRRKKKERKKERKKAASCINFHLPSPLAFILASGRLFEHAQIVLPVKNIMGHFTLCISHFSHSILYFIHNSLLCNFNKCYIIRGALNKFPDFFVWAFKIIVDFWKYSMLLLYILWDDWPIHMISVSNELLQHELEYTLLKPDCHSWWISKMQSGHLDTLEERYAIKFCFKLGKNATETCGILQTAFGASCINRASVFEWHKRFKDGRESVRDDERCGRSKEVRTPELISQRVRVTMLRF